MSLDTLLILVLFLGGLFFLMAIGLPVAFCFIAMSVIGAIVLWGYESGIIVVIRNLYDSISKFFILPICMFMLMGQIMFRTGMGQKMLDVMDKWMGKLPGRLALLSVAFSTLFSTMSGSQMASASMMGTLLIPEMQKRGYAKPMTIGPIMGAGGLAMIIPPSALAVLLGAISGISIGRLLIGGLIPGLIMASLYASYIVMRCIVQPSVAPAYDLKPTPLKKKLLDTLYYVLPLGLIVFLVLACIFLGWTTPTESAVLGVAGSLFLAACYRKLTIKIVKESFVSTIQISAAILMILAGAITFGQILAFAGITRGLASYVCFLQVPPIMIVILMQISLLFLGTFMDVGAMAMVTMPIFMPIIHALGIDPVWFGILVLLNMEMASITPPIGMMLFVMRGVCPPGTTMGDVYKSSLPFLMCDLVAMALIMIFPILTLWLPGMMV
ncbi:MAG: TRAP transporter large permease subunit [Deltaproteobacteria bacterium]|nr:TRAP transporter large permease subunit [Deltaproteobacteria bacterium]